MPQTKPDYMLVERGRYYYQRKVPLDLQPAVGRKKWRAPLGKDFDEAYGRLRDLKHQHDTLIAKLGNAEERQIYKTNQRRKREADQYRRYAEDDAAEEKWRIENGLKTQAQEYADYLEDLDAAGYQEAPPWEQAEAHMEATERERRRHLPPTMEEVEEQQRLIDQLLGSGNKPRVLITLPPFESFKRLRGELPAEWQHFVQLQDSLPEPMDDDEYFDSLSTALNAYFGDHVSPPSDPDQRDQYDFTKMKLERKIARVARDPDTLRKVAERFYAFAQLREKTEHKYRRTLDRLINELGNIPIGQVTSRMLRDYRDKLKARGLLPSSIRSEFSPVMGLFNYAVDEELIEISPMVSVKLPKERRAVEESKWLPFDVEECQRILTAASEIWGKPVQGLSGERRQALQMAVRVLAFTAMRPAEFMALRPDQVDERAIRVEGGKTKSSWRVIPLHPEIADFLAWLHAGGLDAFNNSSTGNKQTDTVTVLRHNFIKLIRKKMDEPIIHRRKALYSLRSTFQNAMRRAGAPKDVRRAILGHVESGAIRHYDDGPSFELLKQWVERADPRN